MKKILATLTLALLAPIGLAAAQTTHTVAMSYTASTDSTTANPGTVTAFYATSACGTSGQTFAQLAANGPASDTAAAPWKVNLAGPGTYCFYVEAVIGGASSVPSNTSGGSANPFPPAAFTVTVQ